MPYGLNTAVLLMQLISEYNYYKSKEALTADGFFYSTVEHLENETCLSGHEQRKAINLLAELNILIVLSKGIPAKRHFKINFEGIANLFDKIEKDKSKQQNSKMLKFLITSDKKAEQQADKNFNTNNKIYNNKNNIDGLKDYITNLLLEADEQAELETEFQRLNISATDEYIEILSQSAYERLLLMRAGVASVFNTPHKYKLQYLTAKKLIALYDKYAEAETKSSINEPIQYFRKIIIEYLDEKVNV